MNKLLLIGTAALSFSVVAPANAAVALYDGAGFVQPAENVLLPANQTGSTIFGTTNQTNTSVTFNSPTDTLTTPANGQARIESTDDPSSVEALNFFLTAGQGLLGFTQFEFNLFNAVGSAIQTVVVTYTGTNGGTFMNTLTLNGQNFLAGEATGGDYFTNIAFDTSGPGVNDVRQIRIGGLVPAAVPEPATWAMMLVGFGILGASMRRRRKTTVRGRVSFA